MSQKKKGNEIGASIENWKIVQILQNYYAQESKKESRVVERTKRKAIIILFDLFMGFYETYGGHGNMDMRKEKKNTRQMGVFRISMRLLIFRVGFSSNSNFNDDYRMDILLVCDIQVVYGCVKFASLAHMGLQFTDNYLMGQDDGLSWPLGSFCGSL